jgi:hypothetical protein
MFQYHGYCDDRGYCQDRSCCVEKGPEYTEVDCVREHSRMNTQEHRAMRRLWVLHARARRACVPQGEKHVWL